MVLVKETGPRTSFTLHGCCMYLVFLARMNFYLSAGRGTSRIDCTGASAANEQSEERDSRSSGKVFQLDWQAELIYASSFLITRS